MNEHHATRRQDSLFFLVYGDDEVISKTNPQEELMKHTALTMTVTLALTLAGALTATSASADAADDRSPTDLVRIVKKSDPGTRTVGRVSASGSTVRAGGVEVTMPTRGDVAAVGDDTVMSGNGVDYVSRRVDRGFQVAAVISDASQSRQTYRFRSKYLELTHTGSVIVRTGGSTGEPVAVIDPAWAVDAHGARVASRFRVDGDVLSQTTDIDGATAFPVVADPRVRWPWYGISVDFNRSETYTIGFVTGGCAAAVALIPHPAGRAFAAACSVTSLMARTARENGKCLSVKFIVSTGYGPVPWISKCYA